MKNLSIYRISVIITMFIKFVFKIYWFNKRNRTWDANTQEKWKQLLKGIAEEYREKAIHLEGLLIKVGQFLSTRADIFPEVFLKEMDELVDRVPPVPFTISKQVLENEWGRTYDHYLKDLSTSPIASASVGEVYKGTLHNGEKVAIKIQRHNIKKIFKTDFKALRIVAWMTKRFTKIAKTTDINVLYHEMVHIIGNELNFSKELQNAHYFQRKFQQHDDIYVPSYYDDLSTQHVLVMEWIEGAKITDTSYLDRHNINRKQLAERLFKAFVEQTIDEGKFHADPHSGNLFVNEHGHVVLIDFGMVGELRNQDAYHFKKLIIEGFVLDDYDLIFEQLEALNFLLPNTDKRKLESILRNAVDFYLEEDLRRLDRHMIEQILRDIQILVREQPIQLPAEFAFLGRAISSCLGVLSIVDPDVDFIELGKPVVQEWLENIDDNNTDKLPFHVLKESAKPMLSIPRNLNRWLESPKYQRHWDQQKQAQRYTHHTYLVKMITTILIFLMSFTFTFIAILLEQKLFAFITGSITVISSLSVALTMRYHKKWIKQISNLSTNLKERG
ncbi:ABC1 kinase family protein [Texcoconibacillus texcoconensis]|uniref:Putative unusual protein kinase regulating ubiquinone biosynthesis (AarF/ABC1/UbiB family) n=1 Tax=Texcoconibacillus texcoconensis TaxID=1095777 RepID=A0A840QPK3_9BACI|nr:AarF/UbiB family protein [Texcoconibacillus texcoconensis]MBB5173289.1 putative unusual protein kinase regulating ubiquinone biosynthesis (AarF/ABC1/UbiB family) [Texcoconibacillus texcoconensis]